MPLDNGGHGIPALLRGGVLALDIATKTGFAYANPDAVAGWQPLASAKMDLPLQSGVRKLGRGGGDIPRGERYHGLHGWLSDMLRLARPSVVVVEAPLIGGASRNAEAARIAFGLTGIVEERAAFHGIAYRDMHLNTVRKHWLGSGKMASRDAKAASVERCLSRFGRVVTDHNEADALGALDAFVSSLLLGGGA